MSKELSFIEKANTNVKGVATPKIPHNPLSFIEKVRKGSSADTCCRYSGTWLKPKRRQLWLKPKSQKSSRKQIKDREKREKRYSEVAEYLLSKGWKKGVYEYPDIPGKFMYTVCHPEGGNDVTRTLCQAFKLQAKLEQRK